jgi:putative FmdB family regulatory protein
MPLYRHECEDCGHSFRILVLPGTEEEAPVCPACGSTSTHRKLPLVAVQFKGSGYYKTDHGRKSGVRRERGGSGDDIASPSGSGDEASSGGSKAKDASSSSKASSSD